MSLGVSVKIIFEYYILDNFPNRIGAQKYEDEFLNFIWELSVSSESMFLLLFLIYIVSPYILKTMAYRESY